MSQHNGDQDWYDHEPVEADRPNRGPLLAWMAVVAAIIFIVYVLSGAFNRPNPTVVGTAPVAAALDQSG